MGPSGQSQGSSMSSPPIRAPAAKPDKAASGQGEASVTACTLRLPYRPLFYGSFESQIFCFKGHQHNAPGNQYLPVPSEKVARVGEERAVDPSTKLSYLFALKRLNLSELLHSCC